MTDETPTPASPEIVSTLDDDTGARVVEITRHADGSFTYSELHLDPETEDDWREVVDDAAQTYKTEYAAYCAATRNVEWLMD